MTPANTARWGWEALLIVDFIGLVAVFVTFLIRLGQTTPDDDLRGFDRTCRAVTGQPVTVGSERICLLGSRVIARRNL